MGSWVLDSGKMDPLPEMEGKSGYQAPLARLPPLTLLLRGSLPLPARGGGWGETLRTPGRGVRHQG